ncbi:kinase-like domain-containing protein [Rhizophagus clarus]|uniref:Kinase-like domain-containing protein n=1 Tax=Rhizophagus clarus TaxID=94130 RepID=A0A8H3LMH8_9GLOM|nr:kinase-like domain-containing protein [Rhizophagus clarus]
MSNINPEIIDNLNDWNKWIEEAISKKLIKYYEFDQFHNLQEIGSGGFGKVYCANWKNSHKRYAIKTFFNINNATVKAIVREIQLQREVDFHDNVISFYGVTASIRGNQRKEYSLVIECAENGTLRKYLKENFVNLTWDDKLNLAIQLVYAVSCLHDEGIVHRDLHSNNILVHQKTVKLADFGLSKRIEEISNSRSKVFGIIPYVDPKIFNKKRNSINNKIEVYLLNKKSDVYSIGVLLWEISSGRSPFCDESHDVGLAMEILQGLREKPIPGTPDEYIKLYTECWNIEPDDRPTINQVVDKLKTITTKENIITNVQSSNNNLDVEFPENTNSLHGELSQVIQNFDMINTKEIETSMSSGNKFNAIINDIINVLDREDNNIVIGKGKQKVLNYLNDHNITLQEIIDNLLNNQDDSNSIALLGKFNYLGIGIDIDKQKAFELYQKAAELGNSSGIYNLGYCYENGIGTVIDKKKAFELYQKAADLGNTSGINDLGYCYLHGIGTNIDKKKTFELYQKAADLGDAFEKAFELCQKATDLGTFRWNKWFRVNGIGADIDTAAGSGYSTAQSIFALMYKNGEGIIRLEEVKRKIMNHSC